MSKIYNKTILSSFAILAILVLGIAITPKQADAREDTYGGGTPKKWHDDYPIYNSNESDNQFTYTYQEQVPVYAPAPTPTVYSNSTNPNEVAYRSPAPKKVVKAAAPTTEMEATETEEDSSDLAANAIFGENSFMPSSLIEWIFFAILIILAVIFVRKIYGGAEKYHAAPMKHD